MFKILQYVFCITIMVISLGTTGQELMLDSFGKRNIVKTQIIDSLIKEQFKKNASLDSNKRQGLKNKIGIDSNSLSKLKPTLPDSAKRRELLKQEQEKYKKKGKSLFSDAAKASGLPEFTKEKPKLGGEFRIESYATNTQNPRQLNEPIYSRFYLTPSLSLFGLPFTTDLYYTTEDNSLYNSNSFSMNFDVWAFRDKISEGLKKEVEQAKRMDKMRQYDLQNIDRQKERLQGELDQIISEDALKKEQKKLEEKAVDYANHKKDSLEQVAGKKIEGEKENQISKSDSLVNSKKENISQDSNVMAKDSARIDKLKKIELLDSNARKRAEQIQNTIEKLEEKQAQLEKLRSLDSAKVNLDPRDLDDPDVLISQLDSNSKGAKILQMVSKVEKLQIGVAYPDYSPYVMNGIPVKGLDMHFNSKKTFYGVTVGRGTREDISSFTEVKPEFKRNIAAINYGIGEKRGNHIAIEMMYAKDVLKDLPEDYSPKENKVVSLHANYKLMDNLLLEGNFASSRYKQNIHQPETETYTDSVRYQPSYGFKPNSAYDLKATYSPIESTTIEANYKRVNPSFYTIGNPFLRRNFQEYEVKLEQKLWKKRIVSSVFYKENVDNVMETSETTNNMKGYGVKVETKFKKFPNLIFLYSPYEQGNNHPDSLLRTQNNLAITSATVTYMKRYKKTTFFTLANYFSSHMEFSNFENPVKVKTYTIQENIQMGARTTYSIGYLKSRTFPEVDSINSDGLDLGVMCRTSKKVTLGVKLNDVEYKNGGFKRGGSILIQIKVLKRNTLTLESGYNRLDKIWGLENENMYFGRLNLLFRI